MQLTKDADKLACSMYKAYLEKRKDGTDKSTARCFEVHEMQSFKSCSNWSHDDICSTVAELKHAGLGTMYYDGGFRANEQFIIYMENRFKNGLKEVAEFIGNFIP